MFVTGCTIDGISYRLDYQKTLDETGPEYSGILHTKSPLVFTYDDFSFAPTISELNEKAIRSAIELDEASQKIVY
ncbi:MAG TPA: hypothetical protein VKR32_10595 [Puia sp.]|nr:hypothetical protein [Puia sp.]